MKLNIAVVAVCMVFIVIIVIAYSTKPKTPDRAAYADSVNFKLPSIEPGHPPSALHVTGDSKLDVYLISVGGCDYVIAITKLGSASIIHHGACRNAAGHTPSWDDLKRSLP